MIVMMMQNPKMRRYSFLLTVVSIVILLSDVSCFVPTRKSSKFRIPISSSSSSSSPSLVTRPETCNNLTKKNNNVLVSLKLNSSNVGGMESSNDDSDGEGKNVNFLKVAALKVVNFINRIITTFTAFRKAFFAAFLRLSRRAKILVAAQFIFLTVLFGGLVYQKAKMPSKTRIPPPVEVTWSHFLDLCEWSGKGHVPGKRPAIQIKKPIVVRGDKVSFTVEPDEEKQRLALLDSKLVRDQDKAVENFQPLRAYARKPTADANLVNFLRENNLSFMAGKSASKKAAAATQFTILGMYFFIMIKMYQSMNGGGKNDTGKLARNAFNPETSVSFNDIEGIDKAKYEVMEMVDSLRNPTKYAILGARAPKGCLLCGPPGTGKTMLAKAVATSAGVPLLYCSGSEFVEMYVGRGAARVRRTFEKASKLAPCIVFIDELDALGKKRNPDLDNFLGRGPNDEQEQTLNQLLACMDGLDSTNGVCVLAATNRKEVLDAALTRPGRFDRIVQVPLPDAKGREAILRVHAKKLPGFEEGTGVDLNRPNSLGIGNQVDLSAVAALTVGCCGAELEYIVNEAAIRAVRRVSSLLREGVDGKDIGNPHVRPSDFEQSVTDFYSSRTGKKPGNIPSIIDGMFGSK